jgi:hypothetical protein
MKWRQNGRWGHPGKDLAVLLTHVPVAKRDTKPRCLAELAKVPGHCGVNEVTGTFGWFFSVDLMGYKYK